MMLVGSALKGFAIEASDGKIGTVSDFLFDDKTWKIRWMVVDSGFWLTGRKTLVHPSAMGRPDYRRQEILVRFTKEQVKNSPDILSDAPVSRQMEPASMAIMGGIRFGAAATTSADIHPAWAAHSTRRPTALTPTCLRRIALILA